MERRSAGIRIRVAGLMAAIMWRATVMMVVVLLGVAASMAEGRALLKQVVQQEAPGLSIAGLDYYVQVDIAGPDLGVLIEAINTSTTNNFGRTQLFAFNVTEGADPTSTQLGFMYGYTIQASYTTDVRGVEVEVLDYDDGILSGTVSIQGLILAGPNEVSVVGGTGDFRGAKGYGLVTRVNSSGTIVLYHHEVHFL